MPSPKIRLDQLLVARSLAPTRQKAQALIMAGKVLRDGRRIEKPGTQVAADANVAVQGQDHPFVSRGGLKLARALEAFSIDASNRICLDIGASTGGFTDCLLQYGAAKVYAVDVGYGQLAWSLRQNPRVVVIERTNVRRLRKSQVPEPVDLVTIDVSFISLKIVVPCTLPFLSTGAQLITLVKPQFEVGKGQVGKGGVVKDPAQHRQVLQDLSTAFEQLDLQVSPAVPSPIKGPKGNTEFLLHLTPRCRSEK